LHHKFISNLINGLKISNTPNPPHIWWCPTGPLTFLPIHAAGFYNKQDVGFQTSDFVVSSYTPTLTALLKQPITTQKTFQGLLGVSQPSTPQQSRLPNAAKELAQITMLASNLHVHSLLGELATVENVIEAMEKYSWVHLACHAAQDTSEPTQSAFYLQDGSLPLSKIITKSFPHADFAFLSACQTATGDENLSEEAVHLAAGMLAAGYRSVIATMWSIKDVDAPLIATDVYSHLINCSQPDSTQAAHALHHAVKCLRKELEKSGKPSFLSWVPFIHVGM
jgi:CHAT domain-containing protein